MEMSLRLILLGIAAIIIAGILWDAIRSRKVKLSALGKNQINMTMDESQTDPLDSDQLLNTVVKTNVVERSIQAEQKPGVSYTTVGNSTPITVINRQATVAKSGVFQVAPSSVVLKNSQYSQSKMMQPKKEIIVLHVMAKASNAFKGAMLKSIFDELHLKYGDMNIFHGHEQLDGSGDILFSVASAIEPGYFEIESLENLETPGLVLFFKPSHPNQSIAAFELMLRTAKQLAMRLNAVVMDDHRKPLTSSSIEQYREEIRR